MVFKNLDLVEKDYFGLQFMDNHQVSVSKMCVCVCVCDSSLSLSLLFCFVFLQCVGHQVQECLLSHVHHVRNKMEKKKEYIYTCRQTMHRHVKQ